MSTRALKAQNDNTSVGYSYDGKQQMLISPSLFDAYSSVMFNPVSGVLPGGSTRCDIIFSEEYNLENVLLEFSLTTGADGLVILDPWLIFQEVKVLINNQELNYHQNMHQQFTAAALQYKWKSPTQITQELMKVYNTGTLATGEVIAATTTRDFSLPLLTIFPSLKNISASQGLSRLSIEVKVAVNTGSPGTICRFVQSATANNAWASVSLSNLQTRLVTSKHSNKLLRSMPSPVIPVSKFEDKSYNVNWVAGATQRVNLATEFSSHSMMHGVYAYIYNPALNTTYNDADAFKVFSDVNTLAFEVRYKSRSILKLDDNDACKRTQYHLQVHEKRAPFYTANINALTGSDNSQYLSPVTFIDFNNSVAGFQDQDTYSGLPNATSEIEIIFSCPANSTFNAASCVLTVVMCYYEIAKLNPQNGQISWQK